MLNELEQVLPADIEKRSFEIITEELGDKKLIPGTEPVVKRCIHTSADFDYADNLVFSDHVVEQALDAIRSGASIVTDTQMAKAGINKKRLAQYGGCRASGFKWLSLPYGKSKEHHRHGRR